MLLLAITTNSCCFFFAWEEVHTWNVYLSFLASSSFWKGLFLFVQQRIYTVLSDYYIDNFYTVYILISVLAMNSPISNVSTIPFPCIVSLAGQRAKKVMSDSPGLMDFAIELVNSVLNLPDGQAKIFWRIKVTKVL